MKQLFLIIFAFVILGNEAYAFKIAEVIKGWEEEDDKVNQIRNLVKSGESVNPVLNREKFFFRTPLNYSIVGFHSKTAKFLIESGANLEETDSNDRTALMIACQYGLWTIAEILIEAGANVHAIDGSGKTALHLIFESLYKRSIIGETSLKTIDLLISNGANINAKDFGDNTPLYVAAGSADKNVVEHLIEKKANVNVLNDIGKSPLFSASTTNTGEIVNILLEAGSQDLNARDIYGNTPLHYAASRHNSRALLALFSAGATGVNRKNFAGETPLHKASDSGVGLLTATRILVDHGAEINVEDELGETPIFKAALIPNADIVEFLIQSGAHVNGLNNNNRTVMEKIFSKEELWTHSVLVHRVWLAKTVTILVENGACVYWHPEYCTN